MTEIDPRQEIFELKDVARQLREALADPVVCGVLQATLDRAAKLRVSAGHPLEAEFREAVGDLCFAYRDWWRGPGELLLGPDIARDQARTWEIAGHLWTMMGREVLEHSLTRHVAF